jgi:hypothetical protein
VTGPGVTPPATTGYPSRVNKREAPRRNRSLLRRAALVAFAAAVAVVALPAVASADTPAAWDDDPHVSGLQWLLLLVVIPLGLALMIAVLVSLPSMLSHRGYEPGQSWRAEPEWFGGPRKGVDAADDLSPQQIETAESGRGGTSGKW